MQFPQVNLNIIHDSTKTNKASSQSSISSAENQEVALVNGKISVLDEKIVKNSVGLGLASKPKIRGISYSAHLKKLIWFTGSIIIPAKTVHNFTLMMFEASNDASGVTHLIEKQAMASLESNQLVNNLVSNDPEISDTESRHALVEGLFNRLSDSLQALNKTDSENDQFNDDMRSFISNNAFEKLMLKDYQKAVLFESHIANHMAMQELAKYAGQVKGLESTIADLQFEVARAQGWIEVLEDKVTGLTETLIELLDTSNSIYKWVLS